MSQVTAKVENFALEDMNRTFSTSSIKFRIWIGTLLAIIGTAFCAYIYQLVQGLQTTGMRNYVSWGVYMTNFVFFIGISHAGTLISAILRVTNAPWRRPITRMAEAITLFALMIGAPMVIIDMGRPDRVLNVFMHGRLNSPILWDIFSIATYISGSLLYLYVALIPDLALFRDHLAKPWQKKLFTLLAIGYKGGKEQEKALNKALGAICIVIIPVAISVHTVVSWIFSMTLRPGWHSTIFGPYFVVGAIFSGTAAIVTAMIVFRLAYRLQRYLTMVHFKALAKLLIALNALYIYFTVSEYLTIWYGRHEIDHRLLDVLAGHSPYAPLWWFMWVFGLFLPLLLTIWFVIQKESRHALTVIFVATILINIGMYLKRYLIIVPTMMTPYIPAEAADIHISYVPTFIEWIITAGGFAMFLLLYTLFSKIFPIISVAEVLEGIHEVGAEKVGVYIGDRSPNHPPPGRPGMASIVLIALLLFNLLPNRIYAQTSDHEHHHSEEASDESSGAEDTDEAVSKDAVKLDLSLNKEISEEDDLPYLVAKIHHSKVPEGLSVAFTIPRLFGTLTLGEVEVDDSGLASLKFPEDLPGEANTGELQVTAKIVKSKSFVGSATALVPGGTRLEPISDPFPRAIWSPKTDWYLLLTIPFLIGCVWTVYIYALVHLRRISKLGGK